MESFRSVADLPSAPHGRAVAVGTFDGVHLGHRQVIGSALAWGRANEAQVCVLTFDPHPLEVLHPDDPPQLLTTSEIKAELVGALGVDELLMIPFTKELSQLDAEAFCDSVLVEALDARHVSVGENFRFGHGARGDAELLDSRPQFETAVVSLVQHDGAPVSSSRIRKLLAEGDVSTAAELIGAPFQLQGTVVKGDERGRELGMPTANLKPADHLVVPGAGIYAGLALDKPAAISIGVRPTFEDDGELLVEAHLVDFDGDLYGSTMRLAFLERLRDEARFDSADELVEQMRRDVERVREVVAQA
jgi:riboflavin kinase/FMN adenylyltransferase